MSIFANRHEANAERLDRYLEKRVNSARSALRPQTGERHLRIHVQLKYDEVRQRFLNSAISSDLPFWQSKVFLQPRTVVDGGTATKNMFVVFANDLPIGEISEFDQTAKQILVFTDTASYFGRAVIEESMIGNMLHLFIDPLNRL